MLSLLVALTLQGPTTQGPRLEITPSLPRVGEVLRVQALAADGAACPGAELELRDAGDGVAARRATAADGNAEFVVAQAGGYTLRWQVRPDLLVLAPFNVAGTESRVLLGLWTVPLGLVLGWAALRRGAGTGAGNSGNAAVEAPAAEASHAAVSPGPSRSAAGPSAGPRCR